MESDFKLKDRITGGSAAGRLNSVDTKWTAGRHRDCATEATCRAKARLRAEALRRAKARADLVGLHQFRM